MQSVPELEQLGQRRSILVSVGVHLGVNDVVERCDWDPQFARGSEGSPSAEFDVGNGTTVGAGDVAQNIDAAAVGPPCRGCGSGEEVGMEQLLGKLGCCLIVDTFDPQPWVTHLPQRVTEPTMILDRRLGHTIDIACCALRSPQNRCTPTHNHERHVVVIERAKDPDLVE